MKNLTYYFLAAGTLLSMSACSSDEPISGLPGDGEEVVITFDITTGKALSRAIADGRTADQLTWVIFDENGNALKKETKEDAFTDADPLHTTVNLTLIEGQKYTVAFFADNADETPYSIDDNGNMTIDYNYTYSSDEAADAFYNTLTFTASSSNGVKTVTLKRPFAQVNLYTDDLGLYGVQVGGATVTVSNGAYSKMNLFNGEVSEPVTDALFDAYAWPGYPDGVWYDNLLTETIEGKEYHYIGYFYVLAPQDGGVIDFTFDPSSIDPANYTNIPVKQNYRTNIIGSLLSGRVNFRVTIDPIMSEDNIHYPVYDDVEDAYLIHDLMELAGFDDMVSKGNTFAGKTVKLAADIDLDGVDWNPIGGVSYPSLGRNGYPFNGTFDGDGHKIMNMTTELSYPEPYYYGFFGVIHFDPSGTCNTVIKNVTFENCYTRSFDQEEQYAGNVYAIVAGISYGDVTFDNVHVVNSKVKGYGKVGGILGMAGDPGGVTTFNNCSVENTKIYGVYNCGAFCGLMQNKCVISGTTSIEGTTWVRDPLQERNGTYVTIQASQATPDEGSIKRDIDALYWKCGYANYDVGYCAWGNYYTYFVTATNNRQNWYLYGEEEDGYEHYVETFPQNTIPTDSDFYYDPVP